MLYVPFEKRVGKAKITRIEETVFDLATDFLFPEWDTHFNPSLGDVFSPASLDLADQRVALQTHLWVVEINGLTIVIDTGIGNGKVRPFSQLFDRLDTPLLKRFEEAGFQREDVDYVLLTHLHVDHVGWNTFWEYGQWTPVFPNATYVFSKQEYDFFSTPQGANRSMVFEDSVLPIVEAGLARMVLQEGEEILDGIRFIPTPGHSAGHMAISIESDGETALFSGDVMHSPVQVYHPNWNSVFCLDQESAKGSRAWLLSFAADSGAIVFSAHFPETSAGSIRRGRNGYEWTYA